MTNELFEAEEVLTVDEMLAETSDSCSGCNGCSENDELL